MEWKSEEEANKHDIKILFKAVTAGDLATVREFIHFIDVNQKDEFGSSILHLAATGRNPNIARTLIENKADINATDHKHWTPLHTACSNANIEIINILLESKADANARTQSETIPLHYFVRCSLPAVVQHSSYFQCLSALVHLSSISSANSQGESPLHFSALGGSAESLRMLIMACNGEPDPVDINCTNNVGETPLHYAVRSGKSDIVTCLLQLGADIEISGSQGNAMQVAVKENRHAILEILNNSVIESRGGVVNSGNGDIIGSFEEVKRDRYGFPVENHQTELYDQWDANYMAYQDSRRKAWRKFLGQQDLAMKVSQSSSTLRELLRKGIPKENRGEIWYRIVRAKIGDPPERYYQRLLNKTVFQFEKDIDKDVDRTFPMHTFFSCQSTRDSVRNVLLAYSIRNPSVGYCQSMNFLAGMLLLHNGEEESFWILRYIVEDLLEDYFVNSMIGLSVDQKILESIVTENSPKITEHLNSLNFPLTIFTTRWMMCVFLNTFPTESVMRVWDCFLNEGAKMIIFVSFGILKIHERAILACKNTHELMTLLDCVTSNAFNIDEFLDEAFRHFNLLTESELLERRIRFWGIVSKEREKKLNQVMFIQQDRTYYAKLDTSENTVDL